LRIAQAYSARGEHRRAIDAATEARDIERAIFGPRHTEVADDELLLGQILASLADCRRLRSRLSDALRPWAM
jgi:hypothetical protein